MGFYTDLSVGNVEIKVNGSSSSSSSSDVYLLVAAALIPADTVVDFVHSTNRSSNTISSNSSYSQA